MSLVSVSTINKRIHETEEQLKSLDKLPASQVVQFQKQEFEYRLAKLQEEKNAIIHADAKEQISIRIYGENVEAGKIQNRILVSMLGGFQEIIDNIANTLVGAESSRGSVKDEAKHISDFKVCGTFAGSFGIVLEKEYEQLELTSDLYHTDKVLNELFNILEYSENGEKLIDKIAPFGQRTVHHYKNWLNQMKDNLINVEVNWTNEQSEIRKMDMKYSKTPAIIETLNSMGEIRDEDVEITGAIITGINIRQNTFELQTDINQIIKGKSRPETLIKASVKIGKEVRAKLVKSTCELYTGALKESWFLADVL